MTVRTAPANLEGLDLMQPSIGPQRIDEKVPERVADYLREAILAGVMRPNESLGLVALATKLKVSTTPVREALLSLEREGLVVGRRRRGFRVANITVADIQDIYWLHGVIAGILSERATQMLSDVEIDELERINEQMEIAAAANDDDLWGRLNFEFHRRIYRAAPHSILHRFLAMTTRTVSRKVFPNVAGWTAIEHRPIIQALRTRRGGQVRRQIEGHQQSGALLMIDELERLGFWAGLAPASDERTG